MERRPAKKKLDDGNVIKGDWSGWGEYMQAKVQKLNAQFKEDIPKVPEDVDVPKIFDKVVIYINGYTVPPADELRRLLYLHGGRCQQYYTKRSVTHIIATNLPNSKISELRDELVVHPSWILDSIKARVLLPATQYLLYQPRKAAQKVLNFASNSKSPSTVTKPSLVGVPSVTTSPGLGLPLKDITSVHSSSIPPPTGEPSMDSLNEVSADFEDCETDRNVSDEDETGRNTDLASTSNNVPHEKAIANKDKDAEHIGGDLTLKAPNLNLQEITSVDGKTATKASGSAVFKKPGTSGLPRAGDANFVSEFYNNSRLHYLSTWGAEFKKYTSEIIKSSASNGWKGRGTGRVGPHGRVIMHIDMDSFFVSVTLRDQPHLRGKPIAVCHAGKGNSSDQASANNPYTSPKKSSSFFNSMSEIASCSYEARAAGVRNGMFLGPARKLCPDIHCVPYQFEEYRQVSQKLYDILVSYSHEIEAVSCDEAYIDVSEALEEGETPTKLAKKIRAEIEEATRCTASVGIGSNVLLARLCTRVAKPDGCYHLSREDDVNQFMASQKVDDLPGVGWSLGQKLQTLGAKTCADLQKFSCQALQKEFGPKTGLLLYQYCRGIDDRNLKTERERRSVSAEINYGIRFTKESEAIQFINELADEVQKRLKALDLKGRCITLKMKVRKAGAPTPRKFMGHGICDNIARSCTLPSVTDDSQVIAKQCHALFKQLNVAPEDIRGVGIQVSKLDEKNASSGAKNVRSLFDFMKPQANTDEGALKVVASEREDGISEEVRAPVEVRRPRNEQSKLPPLPRFSPQKTKQTRTCSSEKRLGDLGESLYLPSPSQIDPSVFEALPEDIRRSIEKSYAARNQRILLHRVERQEEEAFEPQQPQQQKTTKSKQSKTASRPTRTLFQASTSSEAAPSTSDLLPSPSQIDPEFLAALPDDVREELEQAYKLKDSNITGNRAQAEASSAPVLPVERGLGNDKGALQSGAIRKEETEKGNRPPSKQKQASLGEAITLPEVKQVIRQWTEAYEAPLEEDVEVLSDYLIRLVGTQNLEQLWRVFKFLDRTVDGREEWQMSCCAVLSQVQQVLSQKYHTKLSANSLKFTKLASVKNSLGRFSNNSRA